MSPPLPQRVPPCLPGRRKQVTTATAKPASRSAPSGCEPEPVRRPSVKQLAPERPDHRSGDQHQQRSHERLGDPGLPGGCGARRDERPVALCRAKRRDDRERVRRGRACDRPRDAGAAASKEGRAGRDKDQCEQCRARSRGVERRDGPDRQQDDDEGAPQRHEIGRRDATQPLPEDAFPTVGHRRARVFIERRSRGVGP